MSRVEPCKLKAKIRNQRAEIRHLNRALRFWQEAHGHIFEHRERLIASHRESDRQRAAWARGGWWQPIREWYRFRQGETYPGHIGVRYLWWLPTWPANWFPKR